MASTDLHRSPQNGASTGPAPKQGALGHDPSKLQGSFAPVSDPSDTQPLLETVALLYTAPYMCTGNGSLTAAAASSARVRAGMGVPRTVAAADALQLNRELSEGATAEQHSGSSIEQQQQKKKQQSD